MKLPAALLLALFLSACERPAPQDSYAVANMDLKPAPAKISASATKAPLPRERRLSTGAELKPLDPAPVKEVRLDTTHKIIEIAPGVKFSAWTFGDQVPGPTVRARVGDRIRFTMTNRSDEAVPGVQLTAAPMMHSMDFHAAMVSPQDKYRSIAPGQTIEFEFTLNYPGVFMYHCGTPMILEHIASGMYGARDRRAARRLSRRRSTASTSSSRASSTPSLIPSGARSTARRSTSSMASGCARRSRPTRVFNGVHNGMVKQAAAGEGRASACACTC